MNIYTYILIFKFQQKKRTEYVRLVFFRTYAFRRYSYIFGLCVCGNEVETFIHRPHDATE